LLCIPSQKGGFFVCLQPHQATVRDSVITTFTGSKPVPWCEPSQNGCFLDTPQAHHQYVPGLTSCKYADNRAILGSVIIKLR
jgi:hypothetical protein